MKRSIGNRSDAAEDQVTDFGGISLATVANYLMLLSQQASANHNNIPSSTATASPSVTFFDSSCPATSSDHSTGSHHHHQPQHHQQRVFECKTCNRQFPSFQALGGHRASHKKPRLSADPAGPAPASGSQLSSDSNNSISPPKPKTHECSICGLEFPIGQALGGHMRRHRAVLYGDHHHHHPTATSASLTPPAPSTALSLSLKLAGAATPKPDIATANKSLTMSTTAAVEMLKRSTSGRNLCLDLNLTPLENGLDQIGKMAPIFG